MGISARSYPRTAAIAKQCWTNSRRLASTLMSWAQSSRMTEPSRSSVPGTISWRLSLPRAQPLRMPAEHMKDSMDVLVVDVGGTHVKVLATGHKVHREFDSGPTLTPKQMVAGVKKLVADWKYGA